MYLPIMYVLYSITYTNFNPKIIHGLAGYHTHKRYDREDHIEIKWDNIIPSKYEEFKICEG